MPKLPRIIHSIIDEGPDILVILALAAVFTFILRRMLTSIKDWTIARMNKRGDANALDTEKNVKTIEAVLGRTLSVIIWVSAVIAILQRLRVDTSAFLTSAGIIGVAVGFGSQTLIKDVIAGLFLLIENQIRVNDAALVNGTAGLVEEVNLRTTVIRAENGALHIFPNGSITSLANLSRGFAQFVLEFVVEHHTDIDKAFAVMNEAVEEMRQDAAFRGAILTPLEIYGIDRIIEQGIVIKGRIKTAPHRQWGVGREANKRIRDRFAKAGIALASREWNIRLEGGGDLDMERLKTVVREILREEATPETRR